MFTVILEVSLRLLGFIHLSLQEWKNRLALKQDSTFRVLCLGESTTFGYKDSYPSQLEEILNQKRPDIYFRVINLGIPGVDSSFILEHLEENLVKYSPHLVVAMMGINDDNIFLSLKKSRFSKIKIFLRNFKSYKLARLLIIHIKVKTKELYSFYKRFALRNKSGSSYPNKEKLKNNPKLDWNYIKLGWHYKNLGDNYKAEQMFKKSIETEPFNEWAYVELAHLYRVSGKYSEAEKLLKKVLERNPFSTVGYMGLGWNYYDVKKYKDAEEMFKKAIQLNSDYPEAYYWLGQIYIQQHKFSQAKDMFEKIILLEPYNLDVYSALFFLSELLGNTEEAQRYLFLKESVMAKYYNFIYNFITRNNFRKLKEILERRGIKLVCVQYPMRSIQPLKDIFKDKKDIIFVDNEAIFKEAVKKEGYTTYFKDSFAGDFGHCTLKGNRLLAENIATVVLKEYFSSENQQDLQ
ncbi:MAG: tetratricopeptide repeat protein [Candidatus Omnitrophica bacterium]|nr:tetratricopeptide repeat protein [Candidatus Omnitrophota bacterium]